MTHYPEELRKRVREYHRAHPDANWADIGHEFNVQPIIVKTWCDPATREKRARQAKARYKANAARPPDKRTDYHLYRGHFYLDLVIKNAMAAKPQENWSAIVRAALHKHIAESE